MNATVELLHTIFAIGALLLLWRYGISPLLVDWLRFEIEELRADLFDHANEGNISFGDPAYRVLRDWIVMIDKAAHKLTLSRILLLFYLLPEVRNQEYGGGEECTVPDIAKGERSVELQVFAFRSLAILGKYLVYRSPVLWPFFAIGVVYLSIRDAIRKVKVLNVLDRTFAWFGRQLGAKVDLREQEKSKKHKSRRRKGPVPA